MFDSSVTPGTKSNNLFYRNIHIPNDFSSYPVIEGNITVYHVAEKVAWKYISFVITTDEDSNNAIPQNMEEAIMNAVPLIISFLAIPGCVIVVSSKKKSRSKLKLNRA